MPLFWFDWIPENRGDLSTVDLNEWSSWMDNRSSADGRTLLDWEMTVERGLFTTRRQYISALRSLCIALGTQRVATTLQGADERILSMVRTLDELSEMINQLTGRLVDWYSTVEPTFSRKESSLYGGALLSQMRIKSDGVFHSCLEEGERLTTLRNSLAKEVSREAEVHYPNCSALVGGLVAARLVARAGGLSRIARMSSGTLQVLGAESALFSHLHAGTPPPKHGIIYQHRRIHAASRDRRGRVARAVASRVVLTARLDHHRGTLDPEFIRASQERIDRAGRRV